MPFTPFHFGPGLLIKGIAPRRFSFTAYAATQVVIDIESGYYLFTGEYPVHRVLHTFTAGVVVGAMVGGVVTLIGRRLPGADGETGRRELGTLPTMVGGVIGGLMHSLLDGVMHEDILPWRPFLDSNPLYHLIDVATLHVACVAAGIAGIALLAVRRPDRGD